DDGFLGQRVPLRLLFANIGGNSKYAERTAALIRERATADPSIVGVTGMGQTRRETVHAAATIGTPRPRWAGLPIVASAPSGDAPTPARPSSPPYAPTRPRRCCVTGRTPTGAAPAPPWCSAATTWPSSRRAATTASTRTATAATSCSSPRSGRPPTAGAAS